MGEKQRKFRNRIKQESEQEILSKIYGETYIQEIEERINEKIAKRIKEEGKPIEYNTTPEIVYAVKLEEKNLLGIKKEEYYDKNFYYGKKIRYFISNYQTNGENKMIVIGHDINDYKKIEEENKKIIIGHDKPEEER